jgi:hypothetical protein
MKKGGVVLCLLFCAGLVMATRTEAQTRADSAAVLLHAADQLRLRGEAAAAMALLQYIERQYAGTAAAADVQRIRLAMRGARELERPGRTELMLWGTTYGAWLGVAVPLMFDADEPEVYGLGFLAGAPAGFLAARAYANAHQPTVGQSRAITFGGSWGTWQGFGWAEALDIGDRRVSSDCPPSSPCFEYYETDHRPRVAAAVLGGLAGIGTGAVLARKPITAGTAAAVNSGALWGSWFGFALSVIAGLEEDNLLGSTLIAGNAALLGTALAAPRWHVNEGRVRLVNVGGLIGGLAGVGVLLIVQPDDEKVAIGIPMIGSAIGLGVGIRTTRDQPASEAPGDGSSGALLNVDGGRWAVHVPDAMVRLDRTAAGLRPAAYVPLLRARF